MAHFPVINVPYRSQWDADAVLSKGDCGIVSACMVANWQGADVTPDGMLRKAGLPVGRLTYDFKEIITAARHAGLSLVARQNIRREDICAELRAGNPVITLLRYSKISGNQDSFAGAHFWVEVGYDATHMVVHDPNFWDERRSEGAFRRVPLAAFDTAIGDALRETGNQPFQSLFVG